MVDFLRGVVPTIIGSDNLFDILCDVLLTADKDLMRPANLECNLNMLIYSFRVVDCSGLQLSAETRRKALFALCRAFQRYQCSQWGMGDILRDVFDLNFIPAIAASVMYVYTITWRQPLRGLIEDGLLSPERERNCSHIRRILQVHWLPEAERLHAPDSLEVTDLRDVTGKWEKLGSTFRLSRMSKDDDSVQSLISYLTPEERTQGCYLRECPCYGRKSPWHKVRRGCKGCWTVFYCSKQCQKRFAFASSLLIESTFSRYICPGGSRRISGDVD
ncbi:hypothetical protein BC629DRAFT_1471167 [Irpex lacteus]|nr:hypothetical protein BC629DRAFT_1471167 [Irpex lacteus]